MVCAFLHAPCLMLFHSVGLVLEHSPASPSLCVFSHLLVGRNYSEMSLVFPICFKAFFFLYAIFKNPVAVIRTCFFKITITLVLSEIRTPNHALHDICPIEHQHKLVNIHTGIFAICLKYTIYCAASTNP